jgi:stage II sporulation protein D
MRSPRHIRVLAAAIAAGVALCLPAAPAGAAPTWTVSGHGFGHGVGMSQYGAYGYAQHGRDYRYILAHYYQGTTIGSAPPGRVRVLLTVASGDVTFKKATAACGKKLNPALPYKAHRGASGVQLLSSAGGVKANCGAKLRATGNGKVRVRGNGTYRGALEVVPSSSGGTLNVINALNIDKYVRGVVANEMPSSWPSAALEAQAVAARSYALTSGVSGTGFSLYDDTRSQVYKGVASETATTNQAVAATRKQVVMFNGAIAHTYYSASSGGQTESIQFGFPGAAAVPYLVSVDDPYDTASPLHNWTLTFSQSQIDSKLGGLLKGDLQDIVVTKTGVSPRIVSANVVGSGGTTKATGSQLQSALGGYSTWMTFSKDGAAAPPPGPTPPSGGVGRLPFR